MKNLAIIILSIALLTQCTKRNDAEPKFDLTGTSWVLKSGSGEAKVTGDLNGNGRNDDDKETYTSDNFFVSVESEMVFQTSTTLLISAKDLNIHEEMSYSITGDEIKLKSDDWGELYFIINVKENNMTLKLDKATFTKTYGRADIVVHSSNIAYELIKESVNPGNTSGINPGNGNPSVKPTSDFKADKYDCIWPCQVNFSNTSANTSGYFFSWKFGETTNIESQNKLWADQKYLKDPYFIYYASGEKFPELHITYKQDGQGGDATFTTINYRIKVLAPVGLGGEFYPTGNFKGNVTISTKLNNLQTWFDIEVSNSKQSRIPNGIYKRGNPNDQIKWGQQVVVPYYLSNDPTKKLLVGGDFYSGFLRYGTDFVWQDSSGEISFQRVK